MMQMPDIYKSDPHNLAKLLDSSRDGDRLHHPKDLASILAHQLVAELDGDLVDAFPEHTQDVGKWSRSMQPPARTFAELLHHENPNADLLDLVKQFAKRHYGGQDGALPQRVAAVLYYATIATALLRNARRISTLDTKSIQEGIAWALNENWLDAQTRQLLEAGATQLPGRG